MADTLYQQLRQHLHHLRLTAIADRLAPTLEAAERDKPSYTRFLADLLAAEVTAVEHRRLRFAKLPARKTLEQFDFDAQPGLDRRLVKDLATLRFIEEKANVLLVGPRESARRCWPRSSVTARSRPATASTTRPP
jgi:DNA replication protein DnaC